MATRGRPRARKSKDTPSPTVARGRNETMMPRALTRREFFTDVARQLRDALPAELAGFEHRGTMNLLKVYYDNERVHYEVWTNSATGTIELGLHFEDGPVSTAAYLTFFNARIVELKHELGPAIELERWTASWGHLYELTPLARLDPDLVEQVVGRLSSFITVLQPMVAAAAIPAERAAAPSEPRGPWRKWRRGRG